MYSCSGGDSTDVDMNVGGEEGLGDSPDKLVDFLKKIKNKKKDKKEKTDGA